jgi:hypothetical protein
MAVNRSSGLVINLSAAMAEGHSRDIRCSLE